MLLRASVAGLDWRVFGCLLEAQVLLQPFEILHGPVHHKTNLGHCVQCLGQVCLGAAFLKFCATPQPTGSNPGKDLMYLEAFPNVSSVRGLINACSSACISFSQEAFSWAACPCSPQPQPALPLPLSLAPSKPRLPLKPVGFALGAVGAHEPGVLLRSFAPPPSPGLLRSPLLTQQSPPGQHSPSDSCKTGTVCPGNVQERLNTNKVDVSMGLFNKCCVLPSERSVYLGGCSAGSVHAGEMFLDQSAAWTAGIQQWDNKHVTPAAELELHS